MHLGSDLGISVVIILVELSIILNVGTNKKQMVDESGIIIALIVEPDAEVQKSFIVSTWDQRSSHQWVTHLFRILVESLIVLSLLVSIQASISKVTMKLFWTSLPRCTQVSIKCQGLPNLLFALSSVVKYQSNERSDSISNVTMSDVMVRSYNNRYPKS
jgi:hypothetical protein